MSEQSETIGELATALVKFQAKMTNVTKQSKNPHLNSKYADLATIRDECAPVLSEFGLAIAQPMTTTGSHVAVKTILMHQSGEWISGITPIVVVEQRGVTLAQAQGSATSYARRYGYQAILALACEDDDGHSAGPTINPERPKPSQPAPSPPKGNSNYSAPKTGKQLFAFLKTEGEKANVDLVPAIQGSADQFGLEADEKGKFPLMTQWPEDVVAAAYSHALSLLQSAGQEAPRPPVRSAPSRPKKTPDQLRQDLTQLVYELASHECRVTISNVNDQQWHDAFALLDNAADLDKVSQIVEIDAASVDQLEEYIRAAKSVLSVAKSR